MTAKEAQRESWKMRIERRLKPNDRGREYQDEAFGLVSWAEE